MKRLNPVLFSLIIALMLLSGNRIYSQQSIPAKKFEDVFQHTIHSYILEEDRNIFVYLPDNSESIKYPVLYLLDGESITIYEEALAGTRDYPHIIIGIETVKNRNRDMIPCKTTSRSGSREADKFLEFFIKELQPFVDIEYNSNGKNILFGGSNAGLFTFNALLTRPESFFAYITSSATIGHCNKYMTDLIKQSGDMNIFNGKYLFICYGTKDPSARVLDYLPDFNKLIYNEFNRYLSIEIKEYKNSGHVPHGGIIDGLKFIYRK